MTVTPELLRCDRLGRRSYDVPRDEVAEITFELAVPMVVGPPGWFVVRVVFSDGTHAPTIFLPWRPRTYRTALEAAGWPVRRVPLLEIVPYRERALPVRGSRELRPPEARQRGWPAWLVVLVLSLVVAGFGAIYLAVG